MLTDSTGARSFQRDTCPGTRLRGCFDFREKWAEELREQGQFSTELVSDSSNLADIFTKCLSNVEFVLRKWDIKGEMTAAEAGRTRFVFPGQFLNRSLY